VKKIWTNGCFDILHRGHIELFKYAKSLGDILVVGIDTDEKVKRDKAQNRPFNCLADRIFLLQSIKYIDEIVSFNSRNNLESLISSYEPDILVVGSDWKDKEVVGEEFAKQVVFFERLENYSTTKILNRE